MDTVFLLVWSSYVELFRLCWVVEIFEALAALNMCLEAQTFILKADCFLKGFDFVFIGIRFEGVADLETVRLV